MKRVLCMILSFALLLPSGLSAFADNAQPSDGFVHVSVECPDGDRLWEEDYLRYSRLTARYCDTGETIPMSRFYDGSIHAIVPAENESRPIEAFVASEVTFTDDINDDYEFYIMSHLAEKGVIRGDEEGRALPFDNVTRAEAVAMIMRVLGVNKSGEKSSGFDDVNPDDWFFDDVVNAKNYGIITGDDENTFSPYRNVSNEEMVAMASRAICSTGMQKEKTNATVEDAKGHFDFKDADKISDWAYAAYGLLEYAVPYTEVNTDIEDFEGGLPVYLYDFYANPQESSTRFNIAETLFRILDNFMVFPSRAAVEYGFDKQMPVIDGSTSTYPFTESVYQALFSCGLYHKDKPEAHSKSHASYQRLINGEVDMIFASVYPASDILQMAEDSGVELELIPIAYDAMIFFTNADNPADGLTSEQISSIYVDNAYSNWKELGGPDALLYPYCRNNDSGSHAQMERHFLNGNPINEKIRNETTSISMSNVLTDVMSAETDDPVGYGLGYSIYYYFNNMDMFYNTKTELKLLSVDGVAPTDETIADGTYPLSNNTYIALRADAPENSPARRMAEFMLTAAGQQCVINAGFGPLIAE